MTGVTKIDAAAMVIIAVSIPIVLLAQFLTRETTVSSSTAKL
jgi:hypothetical protein